MKGQNLRLLIGGKCVAAARECSWHQGLQLQDGSTKDSESDFIEQDVTGKNWDASASALYVDNVTHITFLSDFVDIDDKSFYPVAFVAQAGTRFVFVSKDGEPVKAYMANTNHVIQKSNEGTHFNLTASSVGSVLLAMDAENEWSRVNVYRVDPNDDCGLEALFDAYNNGSPVDVKLSTTEGTKNREVDDDVLLSQGIITDLQLTSANKQLCAFTVQIQGQGEVE